MNNRFGHQRPLAVARLELNDPKTKATPI